VRSPYPLRADSIASISRRTPASSASDNAGSAPFTERASTSAPTSWLAVHAYTMSLRWQLRRRQLVQGAAA